jgi:LPLT family lysophospholipid transporter-like MFS transporter
LNDLESYFADKPAQSPLYIIDVLFGVCLSYLVLQNYALSMWLMPVLLGLSGFLSAWLLLAWRTLNLNISSGTIWTVVGVLIVIMIRLPEAFGSVMFIVLFCAVILGFLYSWLTKLESIIAKIVDRIAQSPFVRKKIMPQLSINPKKADLTMNKQIYPLLIAQFLSAFGDNAILFTVIAMVMQSVEDVPKWYIPALQAVFLIAYVVLGPWVGGIADRHAKARVLLVANIIKAVGAGLLLIHVEPLFAYCIVGVGAAIYSPAKYGILPELVGHDNLVKANSWIEGSTILAIIVGMKVGADVADHSISMALLGTIVLFVVSALATLALPANISKKDSDEIALVEFGKQMALFFTTPRSRFGVLGASIFWAAAASLRVILIAWAPLILMAKNASQIADLTLYLTFGIIAGSIAVPRIIPLEHLRRARIPAYIMGILITCLSLTTDTLSAHVVLFGIGIVGGMFIVPVNACLQEQGKLTIGSGSAVALQNFFQNLSMLLAVGLYTLAASQKVDPVIAMFSLGAIVFTMVFFVSLTIPKRQAKLSS